MAYIALYREWRPKTFDEVIGQDHIIRTLKNAIINNRIAHAYLFCGIRGTGKTSTAKIFAKALNCEKGPTPEPCNSCFVCRGINSGRVMDVIEIDGASNRGIEEIRELRDKIKYPPSEGRYKVYIIDEVHMLTTEAFNALLKTLEEPPKHAIFILATTEPHKLPATILSRCQRFDFKRLSVRDIIRQMENILKENNIGAEARALETIARNAQGAMRDALSILDQCISYSDGAITCEVVSDILGTVNDETLFEFADSIIDNNPAGSLRIIEDIIIKGKDIHQFVKDLIHHFRNLMICKVSDRAEDLVELPAEIIEDLKAQGKRISLEYIIWILNVLSSAERDTRWSAHPRIVLEMAVVKLTRPRLDDSTEGILERLRVLEEKLEAGIPPESDKKSGNAKTASSQSLKTANFPGKSESGKTSENAKTTGTSSRGSKTSERVRTAGIPSEGGETSERTKTEDAGETGARSTRNSSDSVRPAGKNQGGPDEARKTEPEISLEDVQAAWKNIMTKIKAEKISLYSILTEGRALPKRIYGGSNVEIGIKGYEGHKGIVEREKGYIETLLKDEVGRPLRINFVLEESAADNTATPVGKKKT